MSYVYATNDVDLIEVRQTRGNNNELLARATFDSRHLPLSITDAAGQTTRYGYNGRGQILGVTNAKNEVVSFSYDPNGYLTAVDGPLPGTQDRTTFTHDTAGRTRTMTDPDGYTLTFDYNALDRPTKITFPDSTWQQITYDRMKPGIVRDRLGRQTRYTYDSLRQISAVEDALGRITRFDWCKCGDTKSIIDPLGRATTWRHDIQGRVTAKEYADGSKTSFEYERTTSRLRQIRDEKNQLTQFYYNVDNTLREKRYVNAIIPTPSVQFTYDSNYTRMATMEDGNGLTTFAYQSMNANPGAGQLTAIDGPWANDTITFSYDELGRSVTRAINGVALQRLFDAAGRITQMTNALGLFSFTWEGGRFRLSSMQYPNNQRTDYAYHPNAQDQRLQRVTHRLPDNTVLSQYTYAYDAESQITNWIQLQAATTKTWAPRYDAADRLLGVVEMASGGITNSYSYGYDLSDNRTFEQSGASWRDFSYNPLNQLVAISNTPLNVAGYAWDAENRLVAITNGVHRSEFGYDGLGRRTRIVETENGFIVSDRRYLWCGANLCEERDATGAIVFKRFSNHGLRVENGGDLPAGNYFFTRDHLGSIREMTDSNGSIRAQYEYSPFGIRQRLAGDLEAGFGFTGHHLHTPSSLHLTLYRAYDAGFGRWISRDPIGENGGLNLYAYAYNDPVNRRDDLGLWSPDGHDALIKGAFQNRLSPFDIGIIQQSSRDFDNKTQGWRTLRNTPCGRPIRLRNKPWPPVNSS